MTTKAVPTWWARIYIAGAIGVARQILREECDRIGLCVTIEPACYVYTGGEEDGYVVGLINYPRFPTPPEQITERARQLGLVLMERTGQMSFSVMTPETTEWFSRRPADNPPPKP